MRRALRLTTTALGVIVTCVTPALAQSTLSPYRDQQFTEIRGLTDAEVAELRHGHGMGLARAAELNGYPGPRHVLDAIGAGQLPATPEQTQRVQKIFDEMAADARRLGERIVGEEAALEAAFRAGTIDAGALGERVRQIGTLRAELRTVHLAAHLATRAALTPAQIARYNELRGYAADGAPKHEHAPQHEHRRH